MRMILVAALLLPLPVLAQDAPRSRDRDRDRPERTITVEQLQSMRDRTSDFLERLDKTIEKIRAGGEAPTFEQFVRDFRPDTMLTGGGGLGGLAERGTSGSRLRNMVDARTPEAKEQVESWVSENQPELFSGIDADERERAMRFAAPRILKIIETERVDPELASLMTAEFETGVRMFRALRSVREARRDGGDSTETVTEANQALRAAMGAHFDAKLAIREFEVERLRRKLAEAESRIEEQRSSRDQAIDRGLRDLVDRGRPDREPGEAQRPPRRGDEQRERRRPRGQD
ncbi:MAG: hypothetical protein AAF747_05785 [Planctomycetota bacterium]